MIYFDNAATSFPKPKEVIDAVTNALTTFTSSGRGAYDSSLNAARTIFMARQNIAKLFKIKDPLCVAFTLNATDSLNTAIYGLINENDHVVTTVYEHNSVLRPLYNKKAKITIVGLDNSMRIDYNKLDNSISSQTKAVIMSHASNVTGDISDIERISQKCKKSGALLILDCAQTAGILDIDFETMGIDVLCASGHKGLYAPQGVGIICVSPEITIPAYRMGGTGSDTFNPEHPIKMPGCLEAGTPNAHGIAGLLASTDYILKKATKKIYNESMELYDIFIEGLLEIPSIKIYGDYKSKSRIANISFNIGDMDSQKVAALLWDDYEIAVRGGAHCAPLIHKALGTVSQGAVRFSFSHFNNKNEINYAIDILRKIE